MFTAFAGVCTGVLAARRSWLLASVAVVCTLWFFARLLLGAGRPRVGDGGQGGA